MDQAPPVPVLELRSPQVESALVAQTRRQQERIEELHAVQHTQLQAPRQHIVDSTFAADPPGSADRAHQQLDKPPQYTPHV